MLAIPQIFPRDITIWKAMAMDHFVYHTGPAFPAYMPARPPAACAAKGFVCFALLLLLLLFS